MEKSVQRRIMTSRRTEEWIHGFPVGNGYISGMLYGERERVMLLLNAEHLFMPWDSVGEIPDLSDAMEEAREKILAGREAEAAEMFARTAQERGLRNEDPDNNRGLPDPWHPACRLSVETGRKEDDGILALDFTAGEVSYTDDRVKIRTFASFREPMLAMLIETYDVPVKLSLLPIPGGSPYRAGTALSDVMRARYIAAETITASGNRLIHEGRYTTGGGWRMEAEVLGSGAGECTPEGVEVQGGPVLVLMRFDGDTSHHQGDAGRIYARMLEENQPFYRAAVGETGLELDGGENTGIPNETLTDMACQGEIPAGLIEHAFDMGAYLCASSSGDMPPHAMGRWVYAFDSHIFADYVFNMEAEMCLWPAYDRGMDRVMDSLDNLIRRNWTDWQENARKYYGARGLMVACRTSNRGKLTHFSQPFPMAFWTAGGAWLAFMLYDRFLHSMDKTYLQEKALPFMEEAMRFYYDILRRDHEGYWVFCPSYSPENTPGRYSTPETRSGSMAAINAAMDIFCVKELAQDINWARAYLGLDPMPEAKEIIGRIPEYRLQEDGALCEWSHERYDNHDEHRHVSHMVCAYPFFQTKEDEVLRKGCRRALQNRLAANLGNEGCGWSWGHILNIAARLEDRETVALAVRKILTEYDETNLVSRLWTKARNGERWTIPQVDAACALSSGLIEALVYSNRETVSFLPAWPFGSGTVYNICLRGGIRMHYMRWNGDGLTVCLESDRDTETELEFPAGYEIRKKTLRLRRNVPETVRVKGIRS